MKKKQLLVALIALLVLVLSFLCVKYFFPQIIELKKFSTNANKASIAFVDHHPKYNISLVNKKKELAIIDITSESLNRAGIATATIIYSDAEPINKFDWESGTFSGYTVLADKSNPSVTVYINYDLIREKNWDEEKISKNIELISVVALVDLMENFNPQILNNNPSLDETIDSLITKGRSILDEANKKDKSPLVEFAYE